VDVVPHRLVNAQGKKGQSAHSERWDVRSKLEWERADVSQDDLLNISLWTRKTLLEMLRYSNLKVGNEFLNS